MNRFSTPLFWRLCCGLRLSIVGAALLLYPHVVNAAGQPAHELTLAQAIARTLAQNPGLAVFEFRRQILDGRAQTAALRPALNLEAELENFADGDGGDGGEGGDGGDGGESTELTIALSSVIELGGKRAARADLASGERLLLERERQIEALDLLGEVMRRYVHALAAEEQVRLGQDAVRFALDTLDTVRARAAAGGATRAEELRARAALAQAQLQLDNRERDAESKRVALAAMWGERSAEFSIAGNKLYALGEAGNFAVFFQRAQESARISVFATQARLRAAQLRLAQGSASPDLGWALGVRQSRDTGSTSLVAGISAPLFSAHRARGTIDSARAELDAVAVHREEALLNLHTQLFNAFNTRAGAIHSVQRLRTEVLPMLIQALQETERYYRAGRDGYQEWVDAREELLATRHELIAAATTALLATAEIEQLIGERLSTAAEEIHMEK